MEIFGDTFNNCKNLVKECLNRGSTDNISCFANKYLIWSKLKQNISKLLDCTNVLSNEIEEKIDWSKVLINTPILVRNDENHEWKVRNFAGCIDNKVCAYNRRFYNGMPLNCACGRSSWKYAKLKTTMEESEVEEWKYISMMVKK